MSSTLSPTIGLFFAIAVFLTACAHSARYPAPMPPAPEGVCANDQDGVHASAEAPDARPYRRVDPKYPKRAYSRGVQGWVCLAFTIDPDGRVKDAAVVASAPEGYFEEPALTALRQWTYRPIHDGGEPVERPGMRVMLRFALAQ